MPDDAATLRGRATVEDARDGAAGGPVLLVARQLLGQAPALRFEDDEVTQDI